MCRRRLYIFRHILGCAFIILGLSIVNAADVPDDYQWHQYFTWYSNNTPYAIKADNQGNVYVAATAKISTGVVRILQKYSPRGVPYSAQWEPGVPWYVASSTYQNYPLQKIVLDESNNKLYVLFAAVFDDSGLYHFFLTAHNMATGEKEASWNSGYSRHVGDSKILRAGLDIDSNGDVWTIVQGELTFSAQGPAAGLEVKKWSGTNGSPITLSNPQIYSAGKHKYLSAFGIRKTDNKMYISYREVPTGMTGQEYDLVITAWDNNLQFINRKEFVLEFPADDDPTELHHPMFHDGVVDANGNFAVGGHYFYDRWYEAPPDIQYTRRSFNPVIIKFDESLNQIFQYVSIGGAYMHTSIDFADEMELKLEPWPNGEILYYYIPWGVLGVTLLDNNGQVDQRAGLWSPVNLLTTPVEYIEDSGCMYSSFLSRHGVTYIPGDNRLVDTGPAILRLRGDLSGPNCTNAYDGFAVVSFYKRIWEAIPPGVRLFDWAEIYAIAEWARKWIIPNLEPNGRLPSIWEPEPEPLPCPECRYSFSADWRPNEIPPLLKETYLLGFDFAQQPGRYEFPKATMDAFKDKAARMPAGVRFSKDVKSSLLSSKRKLVEQPKKADAEATLSKYIEAVNAMDLDFRVPPLNPKKLKKGKKSNVDFRGVAWATIENVEKQNECSLAVDGGLPKMPDGFTAGWPVATYRFECKADIKCKTNLNFYIGGIRFKGPSFSPRLLEWDGKSFKDITTNIDFRRKVISGQTHNLSTFVILNAKPEFKKGTK
jgi:hypothetical protein